MFNRVCVLVSQAGDEGKKLNVEIKIANCEKIVGSFAMGKFN